MNDDEIRDMIAKYTPKDRQPPGPQPPLPTSEDSHWARITVSKECQPVLGVAVYEINQLLKKAGADASIQWQFVTRTPTDLSPEELFFVFQVNNLKQKYEVPND